MPYGELGRGLNDLAVYPLSGANDTRGSKVDIPGARSLEFSTSSDSDVIEGDDSVLGVAYAAKKGSGSIQVARASLTALAALQGGTVNTTGTTPNQVSTLDESSAAPSVYVAIKGQALSVDAAGSAFEVEIHKAKVGGIQETLELNGWHIPQLDFEFIQDSNSKFITRKLQETRVALA